MTHHPDRQTTTLPITMDGRRWSVHPECGDVFEGDDDYKCLTVKIELHDKDEAAAVILALTGQDDEPNEEDHTYG